MKKCIALLLLLPLCLAAGNISIVRNGRANAVIVVDPQAPRMVKYAASELQNFIKKTSGATLPIVNAPVKGKTAVLVGESACTKKLGIDVQKLPSDGFIVRTRSSSAGGITPASRWQVSVTPSV